LIQGIENWIAKYRYLYFGVRLLLQGIMVLGCFSAPIFHKDRSEALITLYPLLYVVVFFSPYYGPGLVTMSVYASVLPVFVLGLFLLLTWLKNTKLRLEGKIENV